ncbi:unnamed protein product [Caenorhabditis brenneri]
MKDEDNFRRGIPALGFFIVIIIILILVTIWRYLTSFDFLPMSRTPVIVFPDHRYTVDESPEGVKFLCEHHKYQNPNLLNSRVLTSKLQALLKVAGYSFVYKEARAIMIKMDGFVYGRECHEFEPVGGAAPGSYYTYQMYGDNRIQATYYVEDGVSYLAGFCIYVKRNSSPTSYRQQVIKRILDEAIMLERVEQGAEEEEFPESFPTGAWDVKYCGTLRREIMTQTSNGTVFHKEWNNTLSAMVVSKCVGCNRNDQPPAYATLFMDQAPPTKSLWIKETKLMIRDDKLFGLIITLTLCIVLILIVPLLLLWKCFAACKVGKKTKTPVIVFPRHKFTVDESPEGVRFLCEHNDHRTNNPGLTYKLETLLRVAGYSFVYKDARAIMIKMDGFVYGPECHDFIPEDGAAPGTHFTYQMYGDNRIQVIKYVEDGVSYLAGFCIYIKQHCSWPTSYREQVVREIMKSNKRKYNPRYVPGTEPPNSSTGSWNVTPNMLENGEQILPENFLNANWTGKYCEKLQREVMTETSNGAVYHKEWNNMLSLIKLTKLMSKEVVAAYCILSVGIVIILFLIHQLWVYKSATTVGKITKTPVIVFPRHNFTVDESPEGVRFLCEHNIRWTNHYRLTEKLGGLLKLVGYSFVYNEARVIMIKMNGFIYGPECHDFIPESGASPGSHFTYQMYGDNRIQATYYVEDDVSYLAGFCIYVKRNSDPVSYQQEVVWEIMTTSKLKYNARSEPGTEPINFSTGSWNLRSTRVENGEQILSENFPNANWTGKYCETLQRDVMTETSNGAVYHKEWNNILSVMTIVKCVECSKNGQPPAYTSLFIE